MKFIFRGDGPPDFVNDLGVKWWSVDRHLGIWLTEHPDGQRTFVAVDGGQVVKEGLSLEAVAAWAEIARLAQQEE